MAEDLFPDELVGLMADPTRCWLVAITTMAPRTTDQIRELAREADQPMATVSYALAKLVTAGVIVEESDGTFRSGSAPFQRAMRVASRHLSPNSDRRGRQRRYFHKGRIVSVPENQPDLLAVLDLVSQSFSPDKRYEEKEVNALVFEWHSDWALIRRLLVDNAFLCREGGVYWRNQRADD